MVELDCTSCEKKGCCTYSGWKVFFLEEERDRVAALYGDAEAKHIKQFYGRQNGHPVYVVTLPCPFFEPSSGQCRVYAARPLACRIFPVEMEPITGTTYLDQSVCPKRAEARVDAGLIQINVKAWCDKFWQTSVKKHSSKEVPIHNDGPQDSEPRYDNG